MKTENDPLDSNPPKGLASTLAAIKSLETQVTKTAGIEGVVLRYGFFYGPASIVGPGISDMMAMLRRRRFPIVGSGTGVWSFVHINDAARATVAAVKHALPGIYNIVDDEPARVADWLPELARVAGGPEPRHLPKWLAKLLIGDVGVLFMTEIRGASNERAKQSLGWKPTYLSWRIGFQKGLGPEKPHTASQLAS